MRGRRLFCTAKLSIGSLRKRKRRYPTQTERMKTKSPDIVTYRNLTMLLRLSYVMRRELSTPFTEKYSIIAVMRMKQYFGFLILFAVFLFNATTVMAHEGEKHSFITAQGKYLEPNPLFMNHAEDSSILIPQDRVSEAILVNSPVTFAVNTHQMSPLNLSEREIEASQFYWEFFSPPDFTHKLNELTGAEISYTFQKSGTYLIELTIQPPDKEIIKLSTISVTVVPQDKYQLPKNTVTVESFLATEKPTRFILTANKPLKDIYWVIDGKIHKGSSFDHTFDQEYYLDTMLARTVNEDDIVTDTGILVRAESGELSFSLIDTTSGKDSLIIKKTKNSQAIIGVSLGIGIFLLGTIILILRRKSK